MTSGDPEAGLGKGAAQGPSKGGYGGDEGNLGDSQEGQDAVSGDPSGMSNKDFNDLAARAWGAATKSSPSIGYGSGQVDPGLAQAAGLIGIKDWGSPAKTNVSLADSNQHKQTMKFQNLVDEVNEIKSKKDFDPRMLSQILNHSSVVEAYSAVEEPSKFGSLISKVTPFSMGLWGPSLKNKAVDLGFIDDTTLQDVMDDIDNKGSVGGGELDQYGMGTDEDSDSGFWSLMNVARDNPQIFSSLSGEEIFSLVMDPAKFWKFYEENLYNV